MVVGTAGAAQAAPEDEDAAVGYDVSYPQCGADLPPDPPFAVVGLNGGLATTTNPCVEEQLAWAETATGGTDQPRVALYVNTANPGHEGSWWPTSNYYPADADFGTPNPYGACTGANDAACAYIYGYAKAYDNATARGLTDPAGYFWWLDVETMNTWQASAAANRAALEGMAHYYLRVLEADGVGLYSTGYQWTRIVGGTGPVTSGTSTVGPSILNGLPSWLAGATTLAGARRLCEAPSLTGGEVVLTQYVADNLDHDYACP